MKVRVDLERGDFPFFTAEPSGFGHIELLLREPSCGVEMRATITLKAASDLAERLSLLCKVLEKEGQ